MREIGKGRRAPNAPSAKPMVDSYWPPVDREMFVVLAEAAWAPTSTRAPVGADQALQANGSADWQAQVGAGEVTRLRLASAAPSRIFRLRVPEARVKLVGWGAGRVEKEEFVNEIVFVPGDRAVLDVLFERPGQYQLEHRLPGRSLPLATFVVATGTTQTRAQAAFFHLRTNPEFACPRRILEEYPAREPDATFITGALAYGTSRSLSTTAPRTKLRLINDGSPRRPRQHLVRLEGELFVVLSRDGVPSRSLAWTDTLLLRAGEVVDVLVEPPEQQGLVFRVRDVESPGTGSTLLLRVKR